jgi:hypothetical protein
MTISAAALNRRLNMTFVRYVCVVILMSIAATADAQTCAAPIVLTNSNVVSGNTCSGTTQLPSLVNGAIAGGQQIVYRISVAPGTFSNITPTLQPDAGTDVAMFVCANTCSPTASCIAAVDQQGAGGAESASIPNPTGDYFIIVQDVVGGPSCGSYTMFVSVPL